MKYVECRGTHAQIGEAIGEALRGEIHDHIARAREALGESPPADIRDFRAVLERDLPQVLEQMQGMARGAGVSQDALLELNLPESRPNRLLDMGCSNIVFVGGPDGPVWGKNNDGFIPDENRTRPPCVLRLHPNDGIPAVCFTFAGWFSGGDMMNAEGVATGHSSVGSQLQQSAFHVPILQWQYALMFTARSAKEYARQMICRPMRGKGFASVVVDRLDEIFSLESPCPLVQIRRPEPEATGINCVNYYQIPALKDLTNRTPDALDNCRVRQAYLDLEISRGRHDLEQVKEVLQHHGEGAICRHLLPEDPAITEYSMIGLPAQGRAYYLKGRPCEHEYQEVRL